MKGWEIVEFPADNGTLHAAWKSVWHTAVDKCGEPFQGRSTPNGIYFYHSRIPFNLSRKSIKCQNAAVFTMGGKVSLLN